MMNGETRVIVAASTFQAPIHIAICDHLKKLLKPGEISLRSLSGDFNVQKERLKQAFDQVKPTALIAMDIRPDSDIIATYVNANVPIVLTDEEAAGVSTVTTNNFLGGRIAGEYLVKKGRKRIAIVSGRTQIQGGYNAEQRVKGFQQALSVGKLSIPQGCAIEVLNYTREDGIEAMPKLLDIGVDAIFCAAGDICALGLLSVAKERNIRIPEDIAIVGFDDLLIARLSTPALTTIKQPLEKMAEAAYKMAVVEREKILQKTQKVVLDPELVIRQSA